MQHPDKRLE